MASPRIALIHALRLSLPPINAAFERLWPQAVRINLLDDSLAADRERDGALTLAMVARFVALGRYAVREAQADTILFTCSAFGPAIDAVAADVGVPVMKPNTAMIAEAAARGGRIGLLASFAPTLQSMASEFPPGMSVELRLAVGALAAAEAGDGDAHDRLAAEAASGFGSCDVIALAQFSLARAASAVAAATGKPVLTTPDCAVRALQAQFA